MCDCIDAGDEKGPSDEKMQGMDALSFSLASYVRLHVKAMFRHGLLDTHCNHLCLDVQLTTGVFDYLIQLWYMKRLMGKLVFLKDILLPRKWHTSREVSI